MVSESEAAFAAYQRAGAIVRDLPADLKLLISECGIADDLMIAMQMDLRHNGAMLTIEQTAVVLAAISLAYAKGLQDGRG